MFGNESWSTVSRVQVGEPATDSSYANDGAIFYQVPSGEFPWRKSGVRSRDVDRSFAVLAQRLFFEAIT